MSELLADPPSVNYDTGKGTLVYRLSELMFGSLLAAYILGFASFSASSLSDHQTLAPIPIGNLVFNTPMWFLRVTRLVLVSGTYAYLTAAICMRYHIVMLTMPTNSVARARLDFSIALSQAILFGIATISPQWLALSLSIGFVLALSRQEWEFRKLTEYFTNRVISLRWPQQPQDPVNPATILNNEATARMRKKTTRQSVKQAIKNHPSLGWQCVSPRTWVLVALAGSTGVLSISYSRYDWWWPYFLYVGLPLVAFVVVLVYAFIILKQGAQFKSSPSATTALDNEYKKLDADLHKLATKQ